MAYLYQRQVATWSSVVTRDCSIKKQKKTSLIFETGFAVLRNCLRQVLYCRSLCAFGLESCLPTTCSHQIDGKVSCNPAERPLYTRL